MAVNDRVIETLERLHRPAPLTRSAAARNRILHALVWLVRLVDAHRVLFLVAGIGAVVVSSLTGVSAEIYEAVEDGNGIAAFDRPVLDLAISLRTSANTAAATVFTHLGGPLGMSIIAVSLTVVMVWRWRVRTPAILMVIAVAGSLTMTTLGKVMVGRVRPPESLAVPPFEMAPSFPSGHTLNSTVIAGMVAYLVLRKVQSTLARVLTVALSVGWALAMGLSRVFLGHHWLTDVVFAWTLGLAWLFAVVAAHRIFLTFQAGPDDS